MRPPCLTFSVARCSHAPLRSSDYPSGLPHLDELQKKQVTRANTLVRNMLRIVKLALAHNVPFIIENPHSSFLWKLPSMIALAETPGVRMIVCDQCMFGARWRKRTRFLVGAVNPLDAEGLARRCFGQRYCDRSGVKHQILQGRAPGGASWTLVAQKFPTPLALRLARVLLSSARSTFFTA